ncbi:MAG: hypothetical protein JO040_07785 [Gemmatimonadetes bacterium]|nr:hypothetical protein [Gemmatimonadota bacterium]
MRTLLGLGLAALLAGCMLPPSPSYDEPQPAGYGSEGPLRARILNTGGRLMVQTSRPAYVAIFEIVPGRGAGLLYPAYYGEDNFLPGGLNSIWISRSRRYYSDFLSYVGREQSPRYLYLVASDAPLKLSQFIDSPSALRRALGQQRFASFSPYALMDQLSGMILPYGAGGDWADDVLTIYPDRSYDTDAFAASQWVRVQCDDGRVIEGPIFYAYGACGTRTRSSVPPRADNPRQPAQPGDSTKVQEPTRRRPTEPQPRSADDGGTRIVSRPPNIETIPEPGTDGRIRRIPAIPAGAGDGSGAEEVRRFSPRDDDRLRGGAQQEERRSEPRIESREEPRGEARRESPRAEAPRAESPRVEAPRVEAPRVESPRVETPRVESPRVEAPRSEPRAEPRQSSSEQPAR